MPLRRRPGVTGLALALALGALAAAGPARAAEAIYTVEAVAVDVTAETAARARERALARGHRRAFDRLMARLVPRDQLDRVPELEQPHLVAMVRDFEVRDERTSAVRYLAELTFRFKPAAVRAFLRGRDIPFAETRSKPVVVLPVYGAAGDAVLWAEPNPWRRVWARRAERAGLVPLAVPLGDLGDMRAVDAQAALAGGGESLRAIARRYEADDVLVTQALPAGEPAAGSGSVQVITRRYGTPGQARTVIDSVRQLEDESLEDMLARAADAVAVDVEEAWKQANLLRFESRQTIAVEVPLADLEDWLKVRRRLQGVPLIGRMRLERMSRGRADLELAYYGDREQLDLALAQSDLRLEAAEGGGEGGGERWRLRRAEAAAPEEGADEAGQGDAAGAAGAGQGAE